MTESTTHRAVKAKFIIGIDPGVNTGMAKFSRITNSLYDVKSCSIHEAIAEMSDMICRDQYFIRVEDARLRKWYGKSTKGKDRGAGSIKRDCKIWEDFLTDYGFNFEMVDPKHQTTKLSAEQFSKLTGWKGKTNEHGRDAALLVFGYK